MTQFSEQLARSMRPTQNSPCVFDVSKNRNVVAKTRFLPHGYFIGFLTVLLFILDQVLKWVAVHYFQPAIVVTSWFSLRYEENFGIAWSVPIPYPLLLTLNLFLLVALPVFLLKELNFRHPLSKILLSCLLGGALGNISDRVLHGYVIDFIAIGSWPVFNLADMLLSASIFLIFVFYGKIKRI